MGYGKPTAKDMFADATSSVDLVERNEKFEAEVNKSLNTAITDPYAVAAIKNGVKSFDDFANSSEKVLTAMEQMAINKSLSPDALSSLSQALASQRASMNTINKEITLDVPLNTSFAAFDLEAPAKMLTPRPTPLRNRIPRKKGIGTAHRIKRILGYTGTGTGGQGQIWPGITETTQNNFAPGATHPYWLERGAQISYTADDLILYYNSYGLSDQVSWDAQFSGQGFQDMRQLSSSSTLFATMLMEERMLLMARGTQTGYSGALAAPTATVTTPTAGVGQTALVADDYRIYVTADAGGSTTGFGESVPTLLGTETVSSGEVLVVTINAPVVGALGYNIYVGQNTLDNNLITYQGRTTTLTFTLQGSASLQKTGNTAPFTTTGKSIATVLANQAAGQGLSAFATGYDGILPTVLGPNTGYNNYIGSTFSTSNPGGEFQTAFAAMYDAVKADPDEIFLNGNDRKQLSDAIKSGSTANYRLMIENPGEGGVTYGSVVTAMQNEITGKALALTVHPWLPQGVAPIVSWTLPIPDSQVTDVWSNFLVQDYMGVQWPVNQFTYDFSTYFRGTFMCQAPAWNGAVSGIVSA